MFVNTDTWTLPEAQEVFVGGTLGWGHLKAPRAREEEAGPLDVGPRKYCLPAVTPLAAQLPAGLSGRANALLASVVPSWGLSGRCASTSSHVLTRSLGCGRSCEPATFFVKCFALV